MAPDSPGRPIPGAISPAARAWWWVPSLYFAQGLPYVVVMTVSVVMYKRLGISNTDIALYTSWLYLPWVIKPLWSPIVDLYGTKRRWTVWAQFAVSAALAALALALGSPSFFALTLTVLWAMALMSATHDIACDGFYLLALPQREATAFVGVRSTFYRLAMITGQGAFVVFAGQLEQLSPDEPRRAWVLTFAAIAALFAALALWHRWVLPRPAHDVPVRAGLRADESTASDTPAASFVSVFVSFFQRPRMWAVLLFLMLYRFAEAQLVKLVTPFLLDARADGGLGLSTSQVGVAYGTAGAIALTAGGLLGGVLASRFGLKRMLWLFVVAIHLPDVAFVWLSYTQPESFTVITAALALEQFGYGFGFTAYILYMMMISQGRQQTAHYAICTGFMALGMMLPGMFAGALQERLGYPHFFVWVMISTIPGFVVAALVKIDPEYGKQTGNGAGASRG
ncbi:MAG: MFS transporter [Gemmatimonadetes bacterium]|nr:MFS transporter [Gemmatimonadota bacterium]